MTAHRRRGRTARITAIGAAAAIGAVALVGCASTDRADSPERSSPAITAAEEHLTAEHLFAAVALAEAQVPGGFVTSVEAEHRGLTWEVTVTSPEGAETTVELNFDGSELTGEPREERDDESDRAKHRERVAAATLDVRAAHDAVLGFVPGGRVSELGLDTENGRVVWEGDVITDAGMKQEIRIDAGTGELVPDPAP